MLWAVLAVKKRTVRATQAMYGVAGDGRWVAVPRDGQDEAVKASGGTRRRLETVAAGVGSNRKRHATVNDGWGPRQPVNGQHG